MSTPNIIIPTFYTGGIKPESPKYGDVFYNDCDGKIFIYLDKWFETFDVKETEHTQEQIKQMKQEEKQKETEKDKEIEKYRQFKKILRKFMNEEGDK